MFRLIKRIIIISIFIAVGYMGFKFYQVQKSTAEYKTLVEAISFNVNSQNYEEAVELVKIYLDDNKDDKDLYEKGEGELVKCYLMIANRPELSTEDAVSYLEKARAIDPDSLSKEEIERIDVFNRMNNKVK